MSEDKERQIQYQFLDEALDYLSAVEDSILGLTSNGIEIEKINAALRSLHSIKGGAGMMGFRTLSELAHRLEDAFKVLKVQKHSVQIDSELEQLLLSATGYLQQVIQQQSTTGLDSSWFATKVQPLFDRLYDRLGEPADEDAQSILSPEEGQDIIPLLFQTEVEGCLLRLEAVLETGDPQLPEEIEILTQELGGLGEMLQLTAFAQLCESISQQLKQSPHQVELVAQQALQAWRQSQALILTGQWDALPTAIAGPAAATLPLTAVAELVATSEDITVVEAIADIAITEPIGNLRDDFAAELVSELVGEFVDDFADQVHSVEPLVIESPVIDSPIIDSPVIESPVIESPIIESPVIESPVIEPSVVSFDVTSNLVSEAVIEPDVEVVTSFTEPIAAASLKPESVIPEPVIPPPASTAAQYRVVDEPTTTEHTDNTVRVSVKQLEQLNDLFSELIIERNGLDLHLKRLRNLVVVLGQRIKTLEESNVQLRNAYDKVETQAIGPVNLTSKRTLLHASFSQLVLHTQPEGRNFDALELDQYNHLHLLSQEVMETIVQVQEVTSDIEIGLDDAEQTTRELNKTSRQLQSKLTQVRMRPFSDILNRFPRALRELSLEHQKPVQLKIQGEHLLIDRNILEALSEPLMHLLRNAFDHGIETTAVRRQQGKPEQGTIQIVATQQQSRTIITIQDDGSGIPIDKIRARARQMGLDEVLLSAASDEELLSLIFEPGFSTSDRVTALSGRGVGMDVVRNRLKHIQGEITVGTQAGQGTTFTLSVPFTLSVAKVLIAESCGMLLAFPTDVIAEILVVQANQILSNAGSHAFNWNGTMVQLIQLSRWLKFQRPVQPESLETNVAISVPTVLLLRQADQWIGLQVDRCWGEQEVALRQVEGGLPLPAGFSNCAILGDGRVVPLVSLTEMMHWIASCERTRLEADRVLSATTYPAAEEAQARFSLPAVTIPPQPTILIVDDSINVRRFLALTLEKAGYQVAQAKDGQDAIDKLSAGLLVQAVICDIEMPRLDGYEFLARVKAAPALKEIPIAMLTSRSGDKHRRLAMSLGATAYFSKPYNEQTLLQTLEKMVNLMPV